jgi:hypothetical protein
MNNTGKQQSQWKRQSKLCTLQDTKPGVLFSSKRLQTCESPGKNHAKARGRGEKKLLMKSVHIFCATSTSKRDKKNFATNMQTESVTHTLTRRDSWKTWLPFHQLSSGKFALLRRGSENYLFSSDRYSILSLRYLQQPSNLPLNLLLLL